MNRVLAAAIVGFVAGAAAVIALQARDRDAVHAPAILPAGSPGGVAKMTESAATEHRSERYENIESIEQLLALPSEFAQTEALYAIAGRADSGGVQNFIYEAERIADTADRKRALNVLFARLTELDAPSALAMARSDRFSADRGFETQVWRSWGKLDLDEAVAAALSEFDPVKRRLAAQALFAAYGYAGNETIDRIADDLGVRPDSTTRLRYLYDLADRSPVDAIEHISRTESRIEQRQAASRLASHLARTDPDRAIAYATLLDDVELEEIYLRAARSAAASVNPAASLDRVLAGSRTREDLNEAYYAMRELAAQDIDGALQYFDQLNTFETRYRFGAAVARELTKLDPARALAWAREYDRGQDGVLLTQVLGQLALTDPDMAFQEIGNIRHSEQRRQILQNVVTTTARQSPQTAVGFVEKIENARERDEVASNLAAVWAQKDPDAALDWVMRERFADKNAVLSSVGAFLISSNADAAIRLLPRLDEQTATGWRRMIAENIASRGSADRAFGFISRFQGSDDYPALQEAVGKGLARTDIGQAKLLADRLPAGAGRDNVYAQIVAQHAHTDPAEAASWLESIADERRRGFAVRQLAQAWFQQDPDASVQWLNRLPRGRQRDNAIVGITTQGRSSTPELRRLVETIDDKDMRDQALSMQIYALMRTDWRQAQELLDESELSGTQRQNLQQAIDRQRMQ